MKRAPPTREESFKQLDALRDEICNHLAEALGGKMAQFAEGKAREQAAIVAARAAARLCGAMLLYGKNAVPPSAYAKILLANLATQCNALGIDSLETARAIVADMEAMNARRGG